MPSAASIIKAMQFKIMHDSAPINATGAPRETIRFEFAGASQPGDMWHDYSGWTALSRAEKKAVKAALAHIETFLNVDFRQVKGAADPDLNIGTVDLPAGVAGMGGPTVLYTGARPHTITRWDGYAVYDRGINLAGAGPALILHELGHALGLKHPFERPALADRLDNAHYTVMSYDPDPKHGGENDSMMLYDILALQDIWGAAAYNTGDDSYDGPRTATVDVIWDSGGTDALDASAAGHGVRLDLRAGRFSKFGAYEDVAIAFGVTIENALGSGFNDRITGNGGANVVAAGAGNDRVLGKGGGDTLNGNGGDDTLKGGAGADTLAGQGGTDRLLGQGGADTFVYAAGDGADTVADFQDGADIVQVSGHGSKDDVLARADTGGGNVSFDFGGGDVLVIENVTLAQLEDQLVVI